MHHPAPPAQAAFFRLLLEILDQGEEGSSASRGRFFCEACRLMEADVLYKVTPQEGGWVKAGFGPQMELGTQSASHVSGIVRHVLSKRARFLEAGVPPRGPFHRHQDGWAGVEVSSYMAVPIHRRGRIRGVLVVLRSSGRPPFGIEDLSRADLLADALAVSEDVAERISDLEQLARTDSVTRLPNQRYLREVLGRAILRAGESDQALSLVLMEADIRVFSTLDAPVVSADILPRLARVLERNLRGTDMVAHHAGSTFAILLPETTREGSACVIDRLSRAMEIGWGAPDTSVAPPLRWGIACFPEDGIDATTLLSGAARRLSAAPDRSARDAHRPGNEGRESAGEKAA